MSSNKVGARKNAKFKAVSTAPSFNKTPIGNSTPPIPYPVTADLSNSKGVNPTVKFNGDPVYVLDQTTQPKCIGDAPGTASPCAQCSGALKRGTDVKPGFNRRFYPFNAFRSLLGIAGDISAPTYAELYSGIWVHPNRSSKIGLQPDKHAVLQDLGSSAGTVSSVKFNGDPAYVLDQTTQPSCKVDAPGS